MITRVILFFGWIYIFVISLFMILIGLMPKLFSAPFLVMVSMGDKEKYFQLNTFYLIAAGVVLFLLFLLKFTKELFPKEKKDVIIDDLDGEISVSMTSIETMVKGVVLKYKNIKILKVKSTPYKDSVKIMLSITVESLDNFKKEMQDIKSTVKKYIETALEISDVKVSVKTPSVSIKSVDLTVVDREVEYGSDSEFDTEQL